MVVQNYKSGIRWSYQFVVRLVIAVVVVGCTYSSPTAPGPGPQPAPPNDFTPATIPIVELANEPTSTYINENHATRLQFIVDESTSVRTNCQNNQVPDSASYRYQLPLFFFYLYSKVFQNEQNSNLSFTLGRFAENYKPIITAIRAEDLFGMSANWESPLLSLLSSEQGYATQVPIEQGSNFKEALAAVEQPQGTHTIVVLLTDGEFDNTNDVKDVKDGLNSLAKAGVTVFVGLVCGNKNLDSATFNEVWNRSLAGYQVVNLATDSLSSLVGKIQDEITDSTGHDLLGKGRWIFGGSSPTKFEVAGDASVFDVSMIVLTGKTVKITETSGAKLAYQTLNSQPFLYEPDTFYIEPDVNCSTHTYSLETDSNFYGYLQVTPTIPKFILSLNSQTINGQPTVINNQPLNLNASINTDGTPLSISKLTNYGACYEIVIRAGLEKEGLMEQYNFLWYQPSWKWTPPNFEIPQQFPVYVILQRKDSQDVILRIEKMFTAEFVPQYKPPESSAEIFPDPDQAQSVTSTPDNMLTRLTFDFEFEFASHNYFATISDPDLYISTNLSPQQLIDKSESVRDRTGSMLPDGSHSCPDTDKDDQDAIIDPGIEINANNPIIYEPSTLLNDFKPVVKYSVRAFRYVINDCGYTLLHFEWPGLVKYDCVIGPDSLPTCKEIRLLKVDGS